MTKYFWALIAITYLSIGELRSQEYFQEPETSTHTGNHSALDYAWQLFENERHEEALLAFGQAIEARPAEQDAYFGRAFTLERLGRDREAQIAYGTVLALNEKHYESRFYLALLYNRQEQYEQAAEELTRLLDTEAPPTSSIMYELTPANNGEVSRIHTLADRNDLILYHRAMAYHGLGNTEKALKDINRALVTKKDDPKYLMEKAKIYETAGQRDNAEEVYKSLLAVHPGYSPALYNLTRLTANGSNSPASIEAYNLVIRNDSSLIEAWTNRGILYYDLENYPGAIDDFTMAVSLDSSRIQSWINLGMSYSKMEVYTDARKAFERALELNPHNSNARLHLGNTYLRQRKYDRAIKEYDLIQAESPDEAGASFNKGIAYYNLGQKGEACIHLRKAEELGISVDKSLLEKSCK